MSVQTLDRVSGGPRAAVDFVGKSVNEGQGLGLYEIVAPS